MNNYYHNLNYLLEDLTLVVLKSIRTRCVNSLAKIYLTHFLQKCSEIIRSKKREFRQKWVSCFTQKLKNNQQNNSIVGRGNPNVWYNKFDETTKRQYFEITDYKVQVPGKEV